MKKPPSSELLDTDGLGDSGTGEEQDFSNKGLQLLDSTSASKIRSEAPLLDCPRS